MNSTHTGLIQQISTKLSIQLYWSICECSRDSLVGKCLANWPVCKGSGLWEGSSLRLSSPLCPLYLPSCSAPPDNAKTYMSLHDNDSDNKGTAFSRGIPVISCWLFMICLLSPLMLHSATLTVVPEAAWHSIQAPEIWLVFIKHVSMWQLNECNIFFCLYVLQRLWY